MVLEVYAVSMLQGWLRLVDKWSPTREQPLNQKRCDVCSNPATVIVRDGTVAADIDGLDVYKLGAVRAGCNDHPVTQKITTVRCY